MIRLRATIERARRQRGLGLVVLLILVVLLVLLVLHSSADSALLSAEVACLWIVILIMVSPLLAPAAARTLSFLRCARAPPRDRPPLVGHPQLHAIIAVPLRQ